MWAKAVAYRSYGGPEVLELIDTWVPEPGPGQVRVEVRAGGLNPIDGKLRGGVFSAGLPVLWPTRLGSEISGVVEGVGAGVDEFSPGDAVFGIVPERNGHAEALVCSVDLLAHRADTISFPAAAGIAAGGLTAWGALQEIGIQPGDTVVVHGASGAVGSHAVQLARLWGAGTVVGTASQPNHDYLHGLGVIPLAYGDGLAEALRAVIPQGPVKILDAAGRDAVEASIGLVGDPANDVISLLPFVDAEFGVKFNLLEYRGDTLRALADLYQRGELTQREPRVFAFEDVAAAHALLDTAHTGGKVVLQMTRWDR